MAYLILECKDTEINPGTIWSVLDKQCEDALQAEELFVAVLLRPEMQSGTLLVNWVEKWQEKFTLRGKTFIIITNDPQQIDSLEFSHPDKNIVFVTSIKEFENIVQSSQPVTVSEPAMKSDPAGANHAPVSASSFTEGNKEVTISGGDTVSIAGEYRCLRCGISRMWLKGEKATECQNPECFEPSKGWELVYDLF